LCRLVLSCLIVLSDHFSPLFPLLKIVSRFPASRPTWSGAYDTRRASSLSSLSLPSSPSSIITVMVSSTTLFIVLLALALAWAWAWRLLWSLVMAGHGSPWISSPLYLSLLCCHGAWQCTTKSIYIHLLGPWAALQDHGGGVIFRAFVGRLAMSGHSPLSCYLAPPNQSTVMGNDT
jgi:hypothetical protein